MKTGRKTQPISIKSNPLKPDFSPPCSHSLQFSLKRSNFLPFISAPSIQHKQMVLCLIMSIISLYWDINHKAIVISQTFISFRQLCGGLNTKQFHIDFLFTIHSFQAQFSFWLKTKNSYGSAPLVFLLLHTQPVASNLSSHLWLYPTLLAPFLYHSLILIVFCSRKNMEISS